MARMVKMVSTRDLKSLAVKLPGSSPGARTMLFMVLFFCLTATPIFKDTLNLKEYSLTYIDWETYIDMNREEGDQE